jgi:hypothetical protein
VSRAATGPLRRLFRPARPRLLVLVDLVQDIDVVLPVLLAIRDSGSFRLDVAVSRWLERESPRTGALLQRQGFSFRWLRRSRIIAGVEPSLRGVSAVLTASESSHPAHAAGHALALAARAKGVPSYTLQHGLENIGLTGVEARAGGFASDVVFCWFPPEGTAPDLPPETRARLDHVGRPAPPGGWIAPEPPVFDLAVYENLHWDRYGEADREAFLAGLRAVAARPELRIVLRPHPAGAWGERLGLEFAYFANMTLVGGAEARRSLGNLTQSPGLAARVITTPSTIALDAALAGRPVALAADGGSLYRPLKVLASPPDWVEFACSDKPMSGAIEDFKHRVLVEGDAADRIVRRMSRDLGLESVVSPAQPR